MQIVFCGLIQLTVSFLCVPLSPLHFLRRPLWHLSLTRLYLYNMTFGSTNRNERTFEIAARVQPPVGAAERCCDRCVSARELQPPSLRSLCAPLSTRHDSSALLHSSSCMHSCDVSLCVGSRGAWSEVHVGQYGSAVVMTIVLLITELHKTKKKKKKVTWRTRGCRSVDQQSLVSFALLHGRAVVYRRAEMLWSPQFFFFFL